MLLRGRKFSESELELIKQTVAKHPAFSRRKLSLLICQRLDWKQPNGRLKDRACRDVLLRLHERGLIHLPHPYYLLEKQPIGIKSIPFAEPSHDLVGLVSDFSTPHFERVDNSHDRQLWNFLIARYHYLGCRVVVGRHLKYLLYLDQHLIGCLSFGDAVLQLTPRDRWIGWNARQREAHLHRLINNTRFLILPWVKIKNLASKILSLSARIVSDDWQKFFNYRPVLIETFIDHRRFTGSCYQAANWIDLGPTRGKGRSGMNYYSHGLIKEVYVYPLVPMPVLQRILKGNTQG
jgi:hypothetical protein